MGLFKFLRYVLLSKKEQYLYLTIKNYERFKFLVWLLVFNKNYKSVLIFRKSYRYHNNIVVFGLRYYGRNVKRRTNGYSKEYLQKVSGSFCVYCDTKLTKDNTTADHILPISKGGNNSKINLIPSCRDCNEERGDEDFYKYLYQKKPNYGNGGYPFV